MIHMCSIHTCLNENKRSLNESTFVCLLHFPLTFGPSSHSTLMLGPSKQCICPNLSYWKIRFQARLAAWAIKMPQVNLVFFFYEESKLWVSNMPLVWRANRAPWFRSRGSFEALSLALHWTFSSARDVHWFCSSCCSASNVWRLLFLFFYVFEVGHYVSFSFVFIYW